MMLEGFKGDYPPTLVGILELERKEGRKEGIEQGIRKVIVNFIENGLSDEVIAHGANLTIEQVQAIRTELKSRD